MRDAADEEIARVRIVGEALGNQHAIVERELVGRVIEPRQLRFELRAQRLELAIVPDALEAVARRKESVAEREHFLERGDRGRALANFRLEAREIEPQRGIVGPFLQ